MSNKTETIKNDDYEWGFHDEEEALFKANKGLTPEIVKTISKMKNEPQWMLDFRLRSLDLFLEKKY